MNCHRIHFLSFYISPPDLTNLLEFEKMTRQIDKSELNNKKLMTAKEAQAYLEIGRYIFDAEVKKGNIAFRMAGKNKKFPRWVLDQWLNDTTNHIDCSKEEKPTTPTSRIYAKDNAYSLEKLLELWTNKKPSTTASRGLPNSKRKLGSKLPANCPA